MSLHLKCRPLWDVDPVVGISCAIHLLPSTPALEVLEILASSGLMSGLSGASENDTSLFTEPNVFFANNPIGMEKMWRDNKRNIEGKVTQLRGKVVAFMNPAC